jgi:hypothetical protein
MVAPAAAAHIQQALTRHTLRRAAQPAWMWGLLAFIVRGRLPEECGVSSGGGVKSEFKRRDAEDAEFVEKIP